MEYAYLILFEHHQMFQVRPREGWIEFSDAAL